MSREQTPDPSDALRQLPAVDQLLQHPAVARLLEDHPRSEVVRAVRDVLSESRAALRAGTTHSVDPRTLALTIREYLHERGRPPLRRVINATGIVLHTGLGRAPLAEEALEAITDTAAGYCNLEYDLAGGRRGSRHAHARDLLCELTGAEDALVVNNNAAATYLALHALAAGRETIISRGQLVEIGGSYRLPDIMAAAGTRMVEVGTTNRTHPADYERAISVQTAALLRVHASNYYIGGFTQSVTLAELVELGRKHNLLVIDDLGSGLLLRDFGWPEPASADHDTDEDEADDEEVEDESEAGDDEHEHEHEVEELVSPAPHEWQEPCVRDSVANGADLTLFSGDKLLGGPQAGIILGRAALIATLKNSPLARAFRPGKLTLAALTATLQLYRNPEALTTRLPVLRLLARQPAELEQAADELAEAIAATLPDADIFAAPDHSEAGGGSLPGVPFPTWVVGVRTTLSADQASAALRAREIPIICRIRDDALLFDLRTLTPEDAELIPVALAEILREAE